MKKLINSKNTNYVFLFLALALTIIYSSAITNKNFLNFDREMTVDTLKEVNSLNQYLELRKNNIVYDVAPVSDFSHLLDLKISIYTNLNIEIIQNLIIWILILMVVFTLLEEKLDWRMKLVLIFLLGLHPTAHQTVVWVSARKHLLSTLFILISIFLIKKRKSEFHILFGIFFFVLSILSWPISILLSGPISLYLYRLNISKVKKWIYITLLILISISVLKLNFDYYSISFANQIGGTKYNQDANLIVALNGFGRAFFQIICPLFFANSYEEYSIINYIGLILLMSYFFWFIRNRNIDSKLEFLLCWMAPLIVVLAKPTVLFVTDAYVLLPLVFTIIYLPIQLGFEKTKFIFVIIILIFSFKTFTEVQVHGDRKELVDRSVKLEKTCANLGMAVSDLWHEEKIELAQANYLKFLEKKCVKSNLVQVYLYAIYLDKNMSSIEKIKLIRDKFKHSNLAQMVLINLLEINLEQKIKQLNAFLGKDELSGFSTPFGPYKDPSLGAVLDYCNINKSNKDCETLFKSLNIKYKKSTL